MRKIQPLRSQFAIPASVLFTSAAMLTGGCYEDLSPQSQTPTPSQTTETATGQPDQGPITDRSFSGSGSALGGAKRSAQGLAEQAEQASQEVADQADELFDDN